MDNFTDKDKKQYFTKKWYKEHIFEYIIFFAFYIAILLFSAIKDRYEIMALCIIVGQYISFKIDNRKMKYLENHLYNDDFSNKINTDK